LEAVTNVMSTEDKWKILHRSALALMSEDDLVVLEELAFLRDAGQDVQQTPEREAVTERYDEACMTALANQSVRFTISEMDQLLARNRRRNSYRRPLREWNVLENRNSSRPEAKSRNIGCAKSYRISFPNRLATWLARAVDRAN
jgi:hypothetical protein